MIKSISYNQNEILNWIIELYCPNGFECDITYSKGNFYKNIKEPNYKFDLNPQNKETVKANCSLLPIKDKCMNNVIYDPPFLATKGKSLLINNQSNKINKRFTVFENEELLHKFYVESLKEIYRVLKENGIVIVKCQDKVSSGKQYLSHVFIINEATKLGFYPIDIFILLAKNRIVARWQLKQKHARKFHSYFIVLKKSNKKIKYI